MLEIAHCVALLSLRAEKGHTGFRGHSGSHNLFTGCDQDETVPFRFPGEVNHGIFDRIDNLDGYTLLPDAEYLQVSG